MAEVIKNKIQLKRGSGAPSKGLLDIGEPGYDSKNKRLYIGNGLEVDATAIPSEAYVSQKIAEAALSGSGVDLSAYATKEYVNNELKNVEDNIDIDDVVYADEFGEDGSVAPINASTLGGIPAGSYATQEYVIDKIARAQLEGEDVDLSIYATKEELNKKAKLINAGLYTGDLNILGEGGVPFNSVVWVHPGETVNMPNGEDFGWVETWLSHDLMVMQRYTSVHGNVYQRSHYHNSVSNGWHSDWTRIDVQSLFSHVFKYGLGDISYNALSITDANDATRNGWYVLEKDAANNGFGSRGMMRVDTYSHTNLVQTYFSNQYSSKYPVLAQRICFNGDWGEWEWLNPPMVLGAEYRTTERFDSKAVYVMTYNAGSMPNGITQRTGLPSQVAGNNIINLAVRINSGGPTMQLAYGGDPAFWIEEKRLLCIRTTGDFSAYTVYVTVKYTKD